MQYPRRDEGGLGRLKSILSATTSKFNDLEPKRELRAFPLMNSPGNLGRYTQSMTKLLQWTPSLEQEFQKKDDFHKGTIRVPLAWHNSKCLMTLTMRQTGGHNQLLLNLQSWKNASTASEPGWKNLQLNLDSLAL